ncbi:hypothetical protein FS842_009510 [Serendipita sp. 407]|nr:hypothetical protein FRC15_005675 [Serendipita sp. 397]KAG9058442.1 hypothetical protein FS842_009510 [Serendipita sp. 407]
MPPNAILLDIGPNSTTGIFGSTAAVAAKSLKVVRLTWTNTTIILFDFNLSYGQKRISDIFSPKLEESRSVIGRVTTFAPFARDPVQAEDSTSSNRDDLDKASSWLHRLRESPELGGTGPSLHNTQDCCPSHRHPRSRLSAGQNERPRCSEEDRNFERTWRGMEGKKKLGQNQPRQWTKATFPPNHY